MTFTNALSFYAHTGTNEALTTSAASSLGISLCSWRLQAAAIYTIVNSAFVAFQPPGNAFTTLNRLETNQVYLVSIPQQNLPIVNGINGFVDSIAASQSLSWNFQDSFVANAGYPAGVPNSFDWKYVPTVGWGTTPRTDWSAIVAWMQFYPEEGWSPTAAPNTRVQIRRLQLWMKRKATGTWHLISYDDRAGGAQYVADFSSNANKGANERLEPNNGGGASEQIDPGYNFHGYGANRSIMNPTDIANICVTCQSRLILDNPLGNDDRSVAKYLLNVGADYWRNLSAPFASDWSNNGGVGGSSFQRIGVNWRNYTFALGTLAAIQSDPPPFGTTIVSNPWSP